MKQFLFLLLFLPVLVTAQQAEAQLTSRALSAEQVDECLHDIDINLKKSERELKKAEKALSQREKRTLNSERDLEYNEKRQVENVERTADLKGTSNNLFLTKKQN
jgi:hypothetical protein